jgi:undecaprenyl-diphosphatase
MLLIGLIFAFISAWFAVRLFLKIVERYGFKHFGYYRIILGIIFLIIMY